MQESILSKNLHIYFFLLLFSLILGRSPLIVLGVIGTLVSFYYLVRHWSYFFTTLKKNRYLYVSLAFFIPIGISLIDTLNWGKSFSVFSKMILYVFIGTLAVLMTNNENNFNKLIVLTFYSLIFISIDAISQLLFGYHIHGYNPVIGDRVMGIFKDSAHLSYFLGTFTPIVLFYIYQKLEEGISFIKICLTSIALLIFIIAIVIGGARAGFVSFIMGVTLFIIYLVQSGKIKYKLRFFGTILLIALLSLAILSQSELVQSRFINTTSAFGTDQFFQRFSSSRTNIWYVGFKEIPNYWINGVGPKAFDMIYQTYPEDYKIFEYVWQPHLHGLEVMIETGIIGFIPYLLICLYLFIRIFTAKAGNMWIMMGFIAMMPINSHVGLYEGYWLPMIWVPIMLGLSQAYAVNQKNEMK